MTKRILVVFINLLISIISSLILSLGMLVMPIWVLCLAVRYVVTGKFNDGDPFLIIEFGLDTLFDISEKIGQRFKL